MAYQPHTYEPRGKVAALLEAMKACPEKPVWPAADVARSMGVAQANLPAYLNAVLKHKMLYRKLDKGLSYFSLQPFPESEQYVPPRMIPPRGEAPVVRNPLPEPLSARGPAVTLMAPVASRALVPAAQDQEPEVAPEQEREQSAFNACLWLDGDLDLHGLEELEEGGYRLGAADVVRLRRLLAWMPA